MNAVEIEAAVSALALQPFDRAEFPFAFLAAFDNKETTIKRLRKGETNSSDLPGGVLQRNNIHIATCASGQVGETLRALRLSPKTAAAKAKFIMATDGEMLEAEEIATGETIASAYADLAQHFGFFLPLAGISTIKEIKDNPIDVRATGRLNKLYVELLKENPEWATEARRHDMNHFMARLIFCFFAEDTDIFNGSGLFTSTVDQMSERDGSNTHQVIETLFRAMNIDLPLRAAANLPGWADAFPYVNGGLFSDSTDVPRFTRIARSYLLRAGELNWREINPDIFGSMIQAIAEDDERGALGMHYTSVPNILKVLNPLFLDDLRAQLEAAGDNPRMLLNLRKRMARIRVFDPACGSGNFLVIAYQEMRAIEAEINRRRGEELNASEIPIENFRGIELRDFPAEIARLALVIAQFQCDVRYRGPLVARSVFLPLKKENWIIRGNALQIDWLSVCPAIGTAVKFRTDNLFGIPDEQAEIDFTNEGGETYICGNPPYLGSTWQSDQQKSELQAIFESRTGSWKTLDYVAGWFMKATEYGTYTNAAAAFVATNSICQGQHVPTLWPLIFETGHEIAFAHTSFKWTNLATNNAGVIVVIVGISNHAGRVRRLFSLSDSDKVIARDTEQINAYLAAGPNVIIEKSAKPIAATSEMTFGSKPVDGGNLLLTPGELRSLLLEVEDHRRFVKPILGSEEFINGVQRFCLWINDADADRAIAHPVIGKHLQRVGAMRRSSTKEATRRSADWPHKFGEVRQLGDEMVIIVPSVSSESREYLPVGYCAPGTIVSNLAFALFNAPLWNLSLVASRLHLVWIATVCGKLKNDFRYSNTFGWNTFPVPALTEQNKVNLTRCAENILLAREMHYPATIADLYDPETMPDNLRHAHEQNDETLERIYIGRRFRNDTERLEKLFDMYTRMAAVANAPARKTTRKKVQ